MNRFTHLLLLLAAFVLPFLPLAAEDFGPVSIQMVPSAFSYLASSSASPFCDYEIHNRDTAPAEVRLEVQLYIPFRPSLPQSAVITRVIPPGERLLLTVFFPGTDTLGNLTRLHPRVFVNQREYPVKSLGTSLSFTWRDRFTNLASQRLNRNEFQELFSTATSSRVDKLNLANAPVAQWGVHPAHYTGASFIFTDSEDVIPPPVEEAIRQAVMLGATWIVCVNDRNPWPAGVPCPPEERHEETLGFGRIITLRPFSLQDRGLLKKSHSRKEPSWKPGQLSPNARLLFFGPKPIELSPESLLSLETPPIPYQAMLAVMAVFILLIGPVNYLYLKRRRKELLLLVTTPIISLVFCLLVILYITWSEGWYSRGEAYGITLLDGNGQPAVTRAAVRVYSPVSVRKFRFGAEDRLHFTHAGPLYIDLDREQTIAGDVLQPRLPLDIAIGRVEPRMERLTWKRVGPDELEVVNGLGAPIDRLLAADPAGRVYELTDPLAPGARGRLTATGKQTLPPLPLPKRNAQLTTALASGETAALMPLLTPGSAVALSPVPLFYTPGLTPSRFTARHLTLSPCIVDGE